MFRARSRALSRPLNSTFSPLFVREFEKTTGGRDLVLEGGVVSVIGCQAMAYHPLSTVYIPAIIGVPYTAPHIKVADAVAFFDLDNYLLLETPSGAKLWVRKTRTSDVWVYP